MVVNEAMAAGTLPVVSDHVGAGPDLVDGIGEIFPRRDVAALAEALGRALGRIGDPAVIERMRQRVAQYGIDVAAVGFEQAALAASKPPPRR
jgi:glycosyltransferase involved in cell wall biosynthesis